MRVCTCVSKYRGHDKSKLQKQISKLLIVGVVLLQKTSVLVTMRTEDIVRKAKAQAEQLKDRTPTDDDPEDAREYEGLFLTPSDWLMCGRFQQMINIDKNIDKYGCIQLCFNVCTGYGCICMYVCMYVSIRLYVCMY